MKELEKCYNLLNNNKLLSDDEKYYIFNNLTYLSLRTNVGAIKLLATIFNSDRVVKRNINTYNYLNKIVQNIPVKNKELYFTESRETKLFNPELYKQEEKCLNKKSYK